MWLFCCKSVGEIDLGKIKKDFELLEPRILLDATLDFTVSDTLDNIATIETMSALIRSFEEQFDADEDGLLKLLRTELIGGLDGAEDLFSLVEGQEGSGFGELEDIFERVRLSGMQVVEDYRADLNAIFSDADYSEPVLDLRDGVRTYGTTGGGGSEFFDINAREFIRVNGVELPSGDTLNDYFRSSDVIEQIFGSELLWTAGNLADRVDAFFDGFTVETAFTIVDPDPAVPDVQSAFVEYVFEDDGAGGFTTINEFKAAFTETYDNVLAAADTTAAFNDLQTVSLVDVNDAGGGSLISFTQTSADEIGVSVQLPQIETFLDKLDLAENLRTILPVDFAFVGESGVFEYSIGGSTVVDDQGTTTA
ncbi:MAG TPA: hypothetical protein DIT67_06555, partial [Octadecabacter sp.]|nr:hypothetical protein [Octadecabacter sp.]